MRTLRWSILALLLALLVGPHSVFAYSVTGGRIVDAQGQAVQLRGVNWFGFETTDHVVHGLWARNWKSTIGQMRDLGINAVRLPLCPGTLRGSTPSTINYGLNPDLAGRNSLGVLDAVVQYLDAQGSTSSSTIIGRTVSPSPNCGTRCSTRSSSGSPT